MKVLDLARFASLAFSFAAFFAITFAAARATSVEGSNMGLRGLKRQRAESAVPLWVHIDPAVRWMASRVGGLLSPEARADIAGKLLLAGDFLGFSADEFLAFDILASLFGFTVGGVAMKLTKSGFLTFTACGILGAVYPWVTLADQAKKRQIHIARRLPGAIDLIVLSMGAGLDFPGAVRQVVDKSGTPDDALIEELTLMLQMLALGRTRVDALKMFAARVPCTAVQEFVGAIVQSEERGNPVGTALKIQAEVSRQRRTVVAEEAASRAGVAMIAPLMLLFLCILLIIIGPIVMKLKNSGF